MEFHFCPACGHKLEIRQIGERKRAYCARCDRIQYRNPTVGVAVILVEDDRLLLVRRAGSYAGMWCIPCGHVEWEESIEEAAVREFAEETGLQVTLQSIFAVHSNFHDEKQHTVGVWYRGQRLSGALRPGGDLLQVRFFPLGGLPPLKFPTDIQVTDALQSEMMQTP